MREFHIKAILGKVADLSDSSVPSSFFSPRVITCWLLVSTTTYTSIDSRTTSWSLVLCSRSFTLLQQWPLSPWKPTSLNKRPATAPHHRHRRSITSQSQRCANSWTTCCLARYCIYVSNSLQVFANIYSKKIAGMVGKFVEYPFDTIKVRLQTQPLDRPYFRGPLHCLTVTLKQEGLQGLFRVWSGKSSWKIGARIWTKGFSCF